MYDRHKVYEACNALDGFLRRNKGLRLALPYGNACGRSNRGEFKKPLYQQITANVLAGNLDVTTYGVVVPVSDKEPFTGEPVRPRPWD